jgi:hypothetical protein
MADTWARYAMLESLRGSDLPVIREVAARCARRCSSIAVVGTRACWL